MHWLPFQEHWKPNKDARPERIYSELYNSDAFIFEHQRVIDRLSVTEGPLPRMEAVIVGIMLWSDSTHLANFGSASLWPIYMFVGNLSKYIRGRTSLLVAQHLAYIPKVCYHILFIFNPTEQCSSYLTHSKTSTKVFSMFLRHPM